MSGSKRHAPPLFSKHQSFLVAPASLSRLTNHNFVTSQRYDSNAAVVTVFRNCTLNHTVSPCAWVFGLVDTSHTPALGYMEMVQTRDAATLLPIIQRHVAPGTIVHSDQWRAYTRVAGVVSHQTVNHSINFVDPTTAVHTQHIESYWN